MQIRTRLTWNFTLMVASIMGLFSGAVYYSSSFFRQDDFYTRLEDKAKTTARLLVEVNEVDSNLLRILNRNDLTTLPKEQVTVYNYLNQVVYASDDTPDQVEGSREFLNKIRLKGKIRFQHGQQEIVGVAFNHQYERLVVIVSALDEEGLQELYHLRMILYIGLVLSLLVVALAGWIYAGRALLPISAVVSQVANITASNLNQRVKEGNGKDEIALLAITFNQMLDRIQKGFEAQRSFVANASHELRTPLTIITGQIEVTLIKPRSVEEHEAKWKSVLEDIRQLNQLANDLLDLAQVSLDSSNIDLQEVSLDEVIYQASKKLVSKQPSYHVVFEFDGELEVMQPSMMVKGDEALLTTAFLNLMENGCKFSNDHRVQVKLGANDQWITLQFQDNGIGISEADMAYIFQPFFRAQNAKGIQGHGIGLPLTQRIVQLHGGEISVTSTLHQGTLLTLRLPNS
ncbi:MAG: HAMP domain-containing sensor histidine kinase [Bacteroidota bacterium]